MFEGKKDQNQKAKKDDKNQEQEALMALNEKIEKEHSFHSMPKKFREEKKKAGETKKIGLVIIFGGIILMLASVAVLYYFLFIMPNRQLAEPAPETPRQEESPREEPTPTPESAEPEEPIEPDEPVADEDDDETTDETGDEDQVDTDEPSGVGAMLDSDGDGLTDKEEELLDTDPFAVDTDRDGYDDLQELLNLYDPIGPGRLLDNPGISLFTESDKYEVFYPNAWIKSFFDDSLILNSSENHFIQIASQENSGMQSIENWYVEFVDGDSISADRKISFNNWDGIRSQDGLSVHLTDKERRHIFVISYAPVSENEPVYKNIYEMMVRSFEFK